MEFAAWPRCTLDLTSDWACYDLIMCFSFRQQLCKHKDGKLINFLSFFAQWNLQTTWLLCLTATLQISVQDVFLQPIWPWQIAPNLIPPALAHIHASAPSGSSSSYRQTYSEVRRGRLGQIFWQQLAGNIQHTHSYTLTHMQSYVSTWFTRLSCRDWGRLGRQTERQRDGGV